MKEKFKIIVLAAGKGTRMNADLPKVLIPLVGQPLISYLLDSIKKSGICAKPAIVVGHQAELVKKTLGMDYDYIYQKECLGTGHAVGICKEFLQGRFENILVLYGDHPFVSADTITKIADTHQKNNSILTMGVVKIEDFNDWRAPFFQFGRVVRNRQKQVEKIVELKDCNKEQKKITEVNPSYFCFQADWLWENIDKLKNNNTQSEYYLTDLIGLAFEQNLPIAGVDIKARDAIGINTIEHLNMLKKIL